LDIKKLDPSKNKGKIYEGSEFITFLCLAPGVHKVRVSVYLFFLQNETSSHIQFYFQNNCTADFTNQ
jgi:hypothetical protein